MAEDQEFIRFQMICLENLCWEGRIKYFYISSDFELAIVIPTIPFAICQAKENSF